MIVDRDTASRLGLTEIQIDNALGDAFAQAQVSNIYNPFSPQQYHVVMEVAPEFWQNPDVLRELYVSTSGGAVSGTQATQAVAGTTQLALAQRSSATSSAAAIAADVARNLAANSLGDRRRRQYLDRLCGQRGRGNGGARTRPSATSSPIPRRSASITPEPPSRPPLHSICRKANRSARRSPPSIAR